MSEPVQAARKSPSIERTLWRLFLTLFLRGRGSRGLQKDKAPQSLARKLWLTLLFNGLFGLLALFYLGQPVFTLSVFTHAMAFIYVGLFVAASAGEVLFNKEEADILMHRPITPAQLLWAKIGVLVQVSLWIAGSFNIGGFIAGAFAPNGGWLFIPVHMLSTTMQALFCAGSVVVVYQLCLRWFGRERLDAFMTATQVIVSIVFLLAAQLGPQLMIRMEGREIITVTAWWIGFLPPAWFASIDDAIIGSQSASAWMLAGVGVAATAFVLWLGFTRLSGDYERGLQRIQETSAPRPRRASGGFVDQLLNTSLVKLWVRDSVSRAAFRLSAAYLVRDRDIKLRVYPGIAPMLVLPILFILPRPGREMGSEFGLAFGGTYLGLIPLMAIDMLSHSQQWQAADLFRIAPLPGPAALAHGARRAVLLLVTLPMLVVFAGLAMLFGINQSSLVLLLPGLIALPVYAMIPCLNGKGVPLSMPTDQAKSASRGGLMFLVMFVSMGLAGLAVWARSAGYFVPFLIAEAVVAGIVYAGLRHSVDSSRWSPID